MSIMVSLHGVKRITLRDSKSEGRNWVTLMFHCDNDRTISQAVFPAETGAILRVDQPPPAPWQVDDAIGAFLDEAANDPDWPADFLASDIDSHPSIVRAIEAALRAAREAQR